MAESDIYDILAGALPRDHSRQSNLLQVLQAKRNEDWRPRRVLGIGPSETRTLTAARRLLPEARWTICNVALTAPPRTLAQALVDDASELLHPDGWFDAVLIVHALERLRRPESTLREIRRVLSPGGCVIGQVSQFEPMSGPAFWNFTVYGFKTLIEDAGLQLTEMRPGIDGFTLMRRALDGRPAEMSRYFDEESPVNEEIERASADRRPSIRNHRKLMLAGQFVFAACLPGPDHQMAIRQTPPSGPELAPSTPLFRDSGTYWQQRYKAGLDSGAGSYGKFAAFKAEVLNEVLAELDLRSVIDFGCGDGHQLGMLRCDRYLGLDVSPAALDRCREQWGRDPTRRFLLDSDYADESAGAALSLDVIYHLVEDNVFDAYMCRLFRAARQLVVIYSSNHDEFNAHTPHVRHRRFTEWIESQAPGWGLWRTVPNRYPWQGDHREGSFADFFFFRPHDGLTSHKTDG